MTRAIEIHHVTNCRRQKPRLGRRLQTKNINRRLLCYRTNQEVRRKVFATLKMCQSLFARDPTKNDKSKLAQEVEGSQNPT